GIRDDVVHFMETFDPPAGETALALLQRADRLMNDGGPMVDVQRAVPVDEVDGWRLTVDVYVPDVSAPRPVLVLCHGGGWVMGNPRTHDRMAREFAAAGFLTVSVDYPRAPKWPFPAGYQGCVRAVAWAVDQAGVYGGSRRIAIAGDSAGANL